MSKWKSASFTATEIAKKIKNKELTVPPYQRGQVWSKTQEELLIDSIKQGFPFGSLLLYKSSDNNYQLIDGLQRMTTIYKYLNQPTAFFKESDLDDQFLTNLANIINVTGNQENIKRDLANIIIQWVKTDYKTMEDIKNLVATDCVKIICQKFPTVQTDYLKIFAITDLINDKMKTFVHECEELANADVPAIVYEGDAGNLPKVFSRINSKGTHLSKYQILAATWTHYTFKITDPELIPIINYVNQFYVTISQTDFTITDYSPDLGCQNDTLNLYQILFGFGKLITNQYPLLFGKAGKDKDVESCAFNLVNACLANKNTKLDNLPVIFDELFVNKDQDLNKFLVQILRSIELVNKVLKGYLGFKLNSRSDYKSSVYHSEFQICSMIANVHNARHLTLHYDDDMNIVGRSIKLGTSNDDFNNFRSEFKKNAPVRYMLDLLGDFWIGTGDKKLDQVSVDKSYYSKTYARADVEEELNYWFKKKNDSKQEYKKVKEPDNAEKFLLSVIYVSKFSAYDALNGSSYDIEHLAPKGLMKKMIGTFDDIENARLPISSFGNLCLLLESDNRKKKDKILYDDTFYCSKVQLDEIESKYTFTKKTDFSWVDKKYGTFDELKKDYQKFIEDRFEQQRTIILDTLGIH